MNITFNSGSTNEILTIFPGSGTPRALLTNKGASVVFFHQALKFKYQIGVNAEVPGAGPGAYTLGEDAPLQPGESILLSTSEPTYMQTGAANVPATIDWTPLA